MKIQHVVGEITRYNELKEELENIEEEKAKGVWIRSRLEYIENDEKSTRFFFNKSKTSFQRKTITKITNNDRDITNPSEILKELENYYTTLYTSSLRAKKNTSQRSLKEEDIIF